MAASSDAVFESSRLASPERLITELTRGREIADRLRLMLRHAEFDGSADSLLLPQSLVNQLVDTFFHCLSMLRDGADSDEVSQAPSVVQSEYSGDSSKTPAAKDRRGCYKRKRNADSVVKDTTNLIEDGHQWRKYGQKVILNAKHPRNYFRCTHKYDQKCQASKQVQKIRDDPPLFRTTYNGHHTCTNVFKSPHQIIIDATPPDSAVVWRFDGQMQPEATGLLADSIKQEEEDIQIDPVESSHADLYTLPELTTVFEASAHDQLAAFSPGSDVISSDVYSCTASTRSSIDDMDAIVGSFEDFFEFGTLS